MTENSWRDRIAAERMQTDQEFEDHVEASPLSSQQWSLVMTAVEFEIESAEDPESARLVADTSRLPSVMGEIRNMAERGPGMGGGSGTTTGGDGGLLGGVKDALGFGEGGDELQDAAEELTEEYAQLLQTRLEDGGRWETVCELARS